MSRTKAFLKNSMSQGLLQITTFALSLLTSRIMLSCYGSEINGLVSSINQFISYAKLVEAGLAGAAVYALYAPLASKDEKEINMIVSATKRDYLNTGILFTIIMLFIAVLYPNFVEVTVLSNKETFCLVLILGISGAMSFFITAKYRALFTADQKQYVLAYSSLFSVILNALIIIVAGKILHVEILILKLLCAFVAIAPIFVYIAFQRKHYPRLSFADSKGYKIKSRGAVFINEIFGTIHFGSPIVIITAFCNLLEVSVFSVYKTVFSGINSMCNSLIIPMSASFGETLAIEDKRPFKKAYSEFELVYYAMSSVIYSCACVLILSFVSIYTAGVTDVNYIRPVFAVLFALDAAICNMYGPQAVVIRAGGLFKEARVQTIIQAFTTLVMGVLLTSVLGISGMLIASSISNFIRVILALRLVSKQKLGISTKQTIKRIVASMIIMILIITPFFLSNYVKIFSFLQIVTSNYLAWAMIAIPVVIYALVVCFVVFFIVDRSTLIDFCNRIVGVFGLKRMKKG